MGIPQGCAKREPNNGIKKNIEKKIVKRLLDYQPKGIYDSVRQLIPIQKDSEAKFEIIKYEKIPYNEARKWRTGLRPVGAERVNPWDLIEGLKDKPIDISWFGAAKVDREPEDWQYRERIGQFPKKRPFEEWLTLADLPSEDEEPPDKKANEGDVKFHPQNPNAWMNNGQMNNRFPQQMPQVGPGGLYTNGAQMINPQINQPRPNAPMPPMPNQMWNNQPPHSMSRMPMNPSMNPIRNRIQTTITNRGMPNQHHNMQHQSYGPNGFPPNFSNMSQMNRMPNQYAPNPMNAAQRGMVRHPSYGGMAPNYPQGQMPQMGNNIRGGMGMPNQMIPNHQYRMHHQGQSHMMANSHPGPPMNYQSMGHMQQQQHQRFHMMNNPGHPGMNNMNPMGQNNMAYQGNQRFQAMQRQGQFNPSMMQNQQMMNNAQMNPQNQNRGMYGHQPPQQPFS